MGKKDKKLKKGKGAEKTAAKTEKKMIAKLKKKLAAIGEDDIESMVAQMEAEQSRQTEFEELTIGIPSRRVNCSFIAHPEKDELILFGGEYFNGKKTFLYNDMLVYNISRNEWKLHKSPKGAPPRCGHQMVAVSANKGQLWVFGGEYASPTQSQFYHYKDLWVYHLASKQWEKINALNGPSPRSGHRMVCSKRHLVVFGGFHDNLRDYRYHNDVYAFDLDSYVWKKIVPTGTPPAPRSGCQMLALPDGKIIIAGGYSKERIKKDVDKGTVHTDMFLLSPDKHDSTFTKWKWQIVKQGGVKMPPRCGMAIAMASGNKAFAFGGVFDIEEDEENLAGTFYNDLYTLDTEKYSWRTANVTGKKDLSSVRRRRKKETGNDEMGEVQSDGEEDGMEVDVPSTTTLRDDGVFKVTLGPAVANVGGECSLPSAQQTPVFSPCPRMNCNLIVKHGILYLYGGMAEDGDRQYTFNDFYALDVHKMDEWKTLIPNDQSTEEWIASSSEEDTSSEESDCDEEEDDDDEEDMDTD